MRTSNSASDWRIATLVLLTIGLTACRGDRVLESGATTIAFDNGQGTRISGSLYRAVGDQTPGIVLIHGAGESQQVWGNLGSRLQVQGYTCLLLDLGGHGQSATEQFQYRNFDDSAWAERVNDVVGGIGALVEAGCSPEDIGLIGTDIGATLGLEAAGEANVQTLVLVSPALESHGLRSEPLMDSVASIPVLILSSEGDSYAVFSGQRLKESASGFCEYRTYPGSLHGADLISGSESATAQIEQWLEQTLPVSRPD